MVSRLSFLFVLADQADLSGAAALTTKIEKGRYVYDSLRNKSQATQSPILQWLRQRRIEHRRFYIVNAILVRSTREVAASFGSSSGCSANRGQSAHSKFAA